MPNQNNLGTHPQWLRASRMHRRAKRTKTDTLALKTWTPLSSSSSWANQATCRLWTSQRWVTATWCNYHQSTWIRCLPCTSRQLLAQPMQMASKFSSSSTHSNQLTVARSRHWLWTQLISSSSRKAHRQATTLRLRVSSGLVWVKTPTCQAITFSWRKTCNNNNTTKAPAQ